MHAVRIHQFGDESVLRYEEMPDPQPGVGQVRVAVKAASINRGDLARRVGTYPGEVTFPLALGFEVAGDIDAVGDGVDTRRIGQRVVALAPNGGYAERFVTAEVAAVTIPATLDYAVAASIPVVFLTAWYGLVTTARVQPQEWVLVHAAASGVGMAGIQIAKHCGARVLATGSSAAKLEFGSRLGADATINYTEQDFV
jgi:tumor protein p53-inducible protein 3